MSLDSERAMYEALLKLEQTQAGRVANLERAVLKLYDVVISLATTLLKATATPPVDPRSN